MSKTIQLKGNALEIAKRIHRVHREAEERRDAIEADYRASMERAKAETTEQANGLFAEMLVAAGVPEEELREWGLDPRYLDEHGIAFLTYDGEPEAPNIGDILQSMVSQKH